MISSYYDGLGSYVVHINNKSIILTEQEIEDLSKFDIKENKYVDCNCSSCEEKDNRIEELLCTLEQIRDIASAI